MAVLYTDMDEIHRIIFEPAENSEESLERSSEDDDSRFVSADNNENDVFVVEPEHESSPVSVSEHVQAHEMTVTAGRRKRQKRKGEKWGEGPNWSELNANFQVNYPEFTGLDHGPTHNFEHSSEPIEFYDQLATNELWEILVT